jgi:hypothetical protein
MATDFLFSLPLFGVCGYALVKGERDARIVAIVYFVASFATYAAKGPTAASYS